MKTILLVGTSVMAFALATPSFAAMMDYTTTKMKVEESMKMHPLPEADAKMVEEAVMKAEELHKAGKEEEASKALEDTIKMYKIDVQ